jgi:hypothetical protein
MTATAIAPSQLSALDRIQKIIQVKSQNKQMRYARIRERFNYLYQVERKRYDDCMEIVATEWGLTKKTVQTILKS